MTDCICLDAGASTGGFTDCLLQHGAKKVYAVDVGHAQLHEKMQRHPQVVNMEGVNLRYADEDLLPEKVDVMVSDVSFISLTLIIPPCLKSVKENGLNSRSGLIRRIKGLCAMRRSGRRLSVRF